MRGNSAKRGYDARWRKARESYLAEHPLCVKHHARGEVVVATVVDHIQPHRGNKQLFWDEFQSTLPRGERHFHWKTACYLRFSISFR